MILAKKTMFILGGPVVGAIVTAGALVGIGAGISKSVNADNDGDAKRAWEMIGSNWLAGDPFSPLLSGLAFSNTSKPTQTAET